MKTASFKFLAKLHFLQIIFILGSCQQMQQRPEETAMHFHIIPHLNNPFSGDSMDGSFPNDRGIVIGPNAPPLAEYDGSLDPNLSPVGHLAFSNEGMQGSSLEFGGSGVSPELGGLSGPPRDQGYWSQEGSEPELTSIDQRRPDVRPDPSLFRLYYPATPGYGVPEGVDETLFLGNSAPSENMYPDTRIVPPFGYGRRWQPRGRRFPFGRRWRSMGRFRLPNGYEDVYRQASPYEMEEEEGEELEEPEFAPPENEEGYGVNNERVRSRDKIQKKPTASRPKKAKRRRPSSKSRGGEGARSEALTEGGTGKKSGRSLKNTNPAPATTSGGGDKKNFATPTPSVSSTSAPSKPSNSTVIATVEKPPTPVEESKEGKSSESKEGKSSESKEGKSGVSSSLEAQKMSRRTGSISSPVVMLADDPDDSDEDGA